MSQNLSLTILLLLLPISAQSADPFYGHWQSGCQKIDNPDTKSMIQIRNMEAIQENKKGRFIFTHKFFKDEECKRLVSSQINEGIHSIEAIRNSEGRYNITFEYKTPQKVVFDTAEIIPYEDKIYLYHGKLSTDQDGSSADTRPTDINYDNWLEKK